MKAFKKVASLAGAGVNKSLVALTGGDINGDNSLDLILKSGQGYSSGRSGPCAQGYIVWKISDSFPKGIQALPNIREDDDGGSGRCLADYDPSTPYTHIDGITRLLQPHIRGKYAPNTINELGYVAVVKDLNGDGIDDFVTGVSYADGVPGMSAPVTISNVGRVIFGDKNLSKFDNIYLPYVNTEKGPKGINLKIPDTQGTATFTPMSAGDVNKDGFNDLIITRSQGKDTSESYLIFGSKNLNDMMLNNQTGGWVKITGAKSASGAGDFNGDGFDDLIFLQYFDNNAFPPEPPKGTAYITLGSKTISGFDVSALPQNQKFQININANMYQVYGVGYVNNDGLSDVAITVLSHTGDLWTSKTYANLYVIFGNKSYKGGEVIDLANLKPTQGILVQGEIAGNPACMLTPATAKCDYNKDGIPDIAFGLDCDASVVMIPGSKNLTNINLSTSTLSEAMIMKYTGNYYAGAVGMCAAGNAYFVASTSGAGMFAGHADVYDFS